jgi:hypothetical protein
LRRMVGNVFNIQWDTARLTFFGRYFNARVGFQVFSRVDGTPEMRVVLHDWSMEGGGERGVRLWSYVVDFGDSSGLAWAVTGGA